GRNPRRHGRPGDQQSAQSLRQQAGDHAGKIVRSAYEPATSGLRQHWGQLKPTLDALQAQVDAVDPRRLPGEVAMQQDNLFFQRRQSALGILHVAHKPVELGVHLSQEHEHDVVRLIDYGRQGERTSARNQDIGYAMAQSTDSELVEHAAQSQQFHRRPLLAQGLHHRILLLDALASASDDLIDFGDGDHHDTAVVADDQIARPDDDPATEDRLAQQP